MDLHEIWYILVMINNAIQIDKLSTGFNDRWQELADRAIGGRLIDADEGLAVLPRPTRNCSIFWRRRIACDIGSSATGCI